MAKIYEYERIDDLEWKNLKIIQNEELFCFGTDAVLLSSFVNLKKGETVVDLCTGSGIIAILLAGRELNNEIFGVEILPEAADMAKRSAEMNALSNVHIINADVRDAKKLIGKQAEVVCVNPPYEKLMSGFEPKNEAERIARTEALIEQKEIFASAKALLKPQGRFYLINKVARMAESIAELSKLGMETKKLCFILPAKDKQPKLFMLEAVNGGKVGLTLMPPIIINDENGQYTQQMKNIYHIEER